MSERELDLIEKASEALKLLTERVLQNDEAITTMEKALVIMINKIDKLEKAGGAK